MTATASEADDVGLPLSLRRAAPLFADGSAIRAAARAVFPGDGGGRFLVYLADEVFYLDDAEFTVLTSAFYHVSGGPTVELETSVFGGLHFVHGTHMRSWRWICWFHAHPELSTHVSNIGQVMTHALCLIAMLTCGPSVSSPPRPCRSAGGRGSRARSPRS